MLPTTFFTQTLYHSTQPGQLYEKVEIEEKKAETKSPEPLIEEPSSPKPAEKAKRAVKEEAQIVELDDSAQPEPIVEEELPKKKVSRGKSVQFDIIEEEQQSAPVTPVQEELPKKDLQKGISATKEDAEEVDNKEKNKVPQTPIEEEVPKKEPQKARKASVEEAEEVKSKISPKTPVEEELPKEEPQKGVAASKEDADVIEPKEEPKLPVEEDIPKKKPQRGISVKKEEAEVVDSSGLDTTPQKADEKVLERQESKKGVKIVDDEEDEEMEALLRRAQKQRSLVEDVEVKKVEAPEGTLMKSSTCSITMYRFFSSSIFQHTTHALLSLAL